MLRLALSMLPLHAAPPAPKVITASAKLETTAAGYAVITHESVEFSETLKGVVVRVSLLGPDGSTRVSDVKLGDVAVGRRGVYAIFRLPRSSAAGDYRVALRVSASGVAAQEVAGQTKPISLAAAPAPEPVITAVSPLDHAMHLTFNDEFKNGLDRRVWTPGMAAAGVSNTGETQWYLPDEIEPLSGGGIRLRGDLRSYEGKKITAGAFTSAEGFAQLYGHFEMKAKMPIGPGTWPAFWLLANDNSHPPELDIFENLGRVPTKPHFGYFWVKPDGSAASAGVHGLTADLSADYHVFAVDWRPEALVFSVDGKEQFRGTQNLPSKPMFMLVNLAFGGSWAGPTTAATQFPARLDVAYVRVFQYDDVPAAAPRFLQLGKGNLDQRVARPGQILKYSGSITVGNADVKNLVVHAVARDFLARTTYQDGFVRLGDQKAGAVIPFTIDVRVPETAADGVYNVKVTANISNALNDPVSNKPMTFVYRGLADQFTVGRPLPPPPAIR